MANDPVSIEELTISNTYSLEALIRVLVRKGIIETKEIIEEINNIRNEQKDKIKNN